MFSIFLSGLQAANNPDAQPGKNVDEAAREVTAGCRDTLKADDTETFELGMCLGVLKGLHYLSQDVCIPSALSLGDIASVVSSYFDAHPEQLDRDFRELSLVAMRSAWPCDGRHNI
jgi:Rap1a immunity proteins